MRPRGGRPRPCSRAGRPGRARSRSTPTTSLFDHAHTQRCVRMAAMATSRTLTRRLDMDLVARALAPSREQAQALVAAGLVEVDGALARSAAQPVRPDA